MGPSPPLGSRESHQFDVDNSDSEAIRNLKDMVAAEMKSAPWLSVKDAIARCEAARLAVQAANEKRVRREIELNARRRRA